MGTLRGRRPESLVQTVRRAPGTVRALVGSESASAAILGLLILAAVVWANVGTSYETTWGTELRISLGSHVEAHTLREWVNSGLMTLFFVIVGLEARREFDLGELRDRRRVVVPAVTGLLAMAVPVLIYLVFVLGTGRSSTGWGVAMSTDTAFALGALGLTARGRADRLRVFLLTVLVVDDLASVVVVAVVYSDHVQWLRIVLAGAVLSVFALALRLGIDQPAAYAVLGLVVWAALLDSGIDPIAAGLAIGLLATAYPPRRASLEQATRTFRTFREEPTVDAARTATVAVTATQSPNNRLRRFYLPWTSYVIVPLFGLANAGVRLDADALHDAVTSPLTWGVVVAFLVGKPVGYLVAAMVLSLSTRGHAPSPLGRVGVVVAGAAASAPFTLSLLIADRAFAGSTLNDVKIGALAALVGSLATGGLGAFTLRRMSPQARARALQGDGFVLTDLQTPVDDAVDHWRGAADADVTIVEYGDLECPHCGRAEPTARTELAEDAHIRYVWRHLPLAEVHPHARLAAEATEAAGVQGRFWDMHDRLLADQQHLSRACLNEHARALGLDVDRFETELDTGVYGGRVQRDETSAEDSEVTGTPTFFVNGRRHYGGYDLASIREAVREARQRSLVARP